MQIGERSFAGYPSYKWSKLPDAAVLPAPEKAESPGTPVSTPVPSDLGTSSSLANLLWRTRSATSGATGVGTSVDDTSSSEDI